jgi:hypothetical protein
MQTFHADTSGFSLYPLTVRRSDVMLPLYAVFDTAGAAVAHTMPVTSKWSKAGQASATGSE